MGCVLSAEEREAKRKENFSKELRNVNQKLIFYLRELQFLFYMNGVCFDSTNRHGVDIVSCSFYYNEGSDHLILGASRHENAFALTQALINGAEGLPSGFSSLYMSLREMKKTIAESGYKYINNPETSTKKTHTYILRQHWKLIELSKKLITALSGNPLQFTSIRRYVQLCNHLANGLSMKPDHRVFVVLETLTVPYARESYVKTYHHRMLVPGARNGFTSLSEVLDKVHRYLGVGASEFSKHSPHFVEDRVIVFSFIHRNLSENLYFGVDETREAKLTQKLIDRARASLTEKERRYYTGKQKILPEPFSTFYRSVGKIQVMLNDSFTQIMQERRRLHAWNARVIERNDRIDIEALELAFKNGIMSEMWRVFSFALWTLNSDLNGLLQEGEEVLRETLQGYLEVFHEIEIMVGNSAVY